MGGRRRTSAGIADGGTESESCDAADDVDEDEEGEVHAVRSLSRLNVVVVGVDSLEDGCG